MTSLEEELTLSWLKETFHVSSKEEKGKLSFVKRRAKDGGPHALGDHLRIGDALEAGARHAILPWRWRKLWPVVAVGVVLLVVRACCNGSCCQDGHGGRIQGTPNLC